MSINNIRNLYINSAPGFRDIGGTDENFTITKNISNFNRIPKRIILESARIPFTWNNITSNNNAFTLIEQPGSVTYSDVTVTPGRYTGTTLATILQTTLNNLGGHTYVVAYDTNSFKFTISATGSFQINFAIDDSIAPALGFTEIITILGTSIISPGVAVIQPDFEIFIASTLIGGIDNGVVPWFTGSATPLNILAVIPISTCFGGIIDYRCSDLEPWKNINQSLFYNENLVNQPIVMGFNLFFLSGIPVDLQGAHWSMDILFEF